ncbi:MAG: Eco57I restriction-modification methylase domain-containing protein [Ktedonobacteraceae bacterium]
MTALETLETMRLDIQGKLDSENTQIERNKLGQFATPPALATDILEYARSILPSELKLRFFDPAFGTGSFFSALLRLFPFERIMAAEGYEIDKDYVCKSRGLWNDKPLRINLGDFTEAKPPETDERKPNLFICNPPYVRHHHLSKEDKQRLQMRVLQTTGLKLSGLAGYYCYFLCLSHNWIAENGLAGWLIPAEFMDVNYGSEIKKYLLENVTLLRIHRFSPKDLQFDDALVSSAIVWYRKSISPTSHTVEFTYGGSLLSPQVSIHVSINALRKTAKWTQIPLEEESAISKTKIVSITRPIHKKILTLSDLFTIKRGLATGANNFFLLTQEQVSEYNLPSEFLIPVLPGSRYLPSNEVNADTIGNPILDRKIFLIDCNLPAEEVESKYPSLWTYYQKGLEKAVDKGFLCSHRSPWYSQENRSPTMFLCTYMGRQNTKSRNTPFRFILNHSRAITTNVYLMLYPKPALAEILAKKPELAKLLWQNLNKISPATLIREGRVYGDGLHKLEPKELSSVPCGNIYTILPELLEITGYALF